MDNKINKDVRKQTNDKFIFFANELLFRFPDLDLRFNLSYDANAIRYKAAAISGEMFEMPLADLDPVEMVHEAVFNIKQLASLFDA